MKTAEEVPARKRATRKSAATDTLRMRLALPAGSRTTTDRKSVVSKGKQLMQRLTNDKTAGKDDMHPGCGAWWEF